MKETLKDIVQGGARFFYKRFRSFFWCADGDLVLVPRAECGVIQKQQIANTAHTPNARRSVVVPLLLLAYLRMFTCRQQSMPNFTDLQPQGAL